MKKRLLSLVLSVILCVTVAVPCFATAGISTKEQALLDKFSAGIVVDGQTIKPPTAYINEATNALIREDLTDEEIATLSDAVDKVYAILAEEKLYTTDLQRASDRLGEIVAIVNAAAAPLNYSISLDQLAGEINITYTGTNGTGTNSSTTSNTVASSKDIINQTGYDMTPTLAVVALSILVLAAGIAVSAKKKFFASAKVC